MFKIKQQLRRLYAVTAISSLQIAGASWVALLAARGFSLTEIGFAEGMWSCGENLSVCKGTMAG